MNLEEAIVSAESTSWQTRAEAATVLARNTGHGAVSALARLLRDEDTAVSQQTAESLLRRSDLLGLRLVATYLSEADPHRADHVFDIIPALVRGEGLPLGALASQLDSSEVATPSERQGAEMILRWLDPARADNLE